MVYHMTVASRDKLPSDQSLLLEYMQDVTCESDSQDGYLGPEDGPRNTDDLNGEEAAQGATLTH